MTPARSASTPAHVRHRRRRVWAALSQGSPQPSLRELARDLGCCFNTIHHDITALADLGYVRRPATVRERAITVVIPFLEEPS